MVLEGLSDMSSLFSAPKLKIGSRCSATRAIDRLALLRDRAEDRQSSALRN
jgi:hypothetical protein